jgi:acylphosphatase
MSHKLCIHCYVSGRVQGVFFRANTQKQAKLLNITGWARNLPDGRVEVFACGEKANLEKLYHWLKQGPAMAQVSNVSYEEEPHQAFDEFSTS